MGFFLTADVQDRNRAPVRPSITHPRTGASTTHINELGQVDYVEDAAANRTSFFYDSASGVEEDAVMAGQKGSLTKSALAWHVHRRTLAGHKWISARLGTGCASNLTAHINRIKRASEGEALRMRRQLEKV